MSVSLVAVPLAGAGLIAVTGSRPNLREAATLVTAVALFIVVATLYPTVAAGARPALAPRIVDQSGNEVYGSGQVSRDYAIQIGVVGYEKDLDRAAANERVAGNPIVVKGVKASGANNADVVISDQDARSIREAGANLNFMEQCKVMVILD